MLCENQMNGLINFRMINKFYTLKNNQIDEEKQQNDFNSGFMQSRCV